jgi:hypothetical protein
MSAFQSLIVKLGGKKFAAMIGGLAALLIITGLRMLSVKFGYPLSDDMANAITLKVTGVVVALILGQSFADGWSQGATSSAIWQQPTGKTLAPLPTNVIPHDMTTDQLTAELVRKTDGAAVIIAPSPKGFVRLGLLVALVIGCLCAPLSLYAQTSGMTTTGTFAVPPALPPAATPQADSTGSADVPPAPVVAPPAPVPQLPAPDTSGNVTLTHDQAVYMVTRLQTAENDKATLIAYNATLAKQLTLANTVASSMTIAHNASIAPVLLSGLGGAIVGGISALVARNQTGCH